MIITVTLILSSLVALNFFLLIFSCNKLPKKIEQKKPTVIRNEDPTLVSTQLQTHQLAATGS
jgi:starvation-inducible outer membrane lipoprotein